MSKLISSESVYWCERDDRYIRVFKLGDVISGINFMQGDEYELFNDNYAGIEEDLTKFYKAVLPYLDERNSEIDDINAAIWAWFEYKNNY
tara:strand:- start:12 stop:281 length:270 start_codon:yes stop_codon:yes gene_type:complete